MNKEYYLGDGTLFEPGLAVTKSDECPDGKFCYHLIYGIIAGEPMCECGEMICKVEFIESNRENYTGKEYWCRTRDLVSLDSETSIVEPEDGAISNFLFGS